MCSGVQRYYGAWGQLLDCMNDPKTVSLSAPLSAHHCWDPEGGKVGGNHHRALCRVGVQVNGFFPGLPCLPSGRGRGLSQESGGGAVGMNGGGAGQTNS